MKILKGNTIIEFKSTPENFEAEHLEVHQKGAKRNIIKFVDAIGHMAITHAQIQSTLEFIRIVNTETGKSFMRKLTDFRVYRGDGVAPGYACWVWSW